MKQTSKHQNSSIGLFFPTPSLTSIREYVNKSETLKEAVYNNSKVTLSLHRNRTNKCQGIKIKTLEDHNEQEKIKAKKDLKKKAGEAINIETAANFNCSSGSSCSRQLFLLL